MFRCPSARSSQSCTPDQILSACQRYRTNPTSGVGVGVGVCAQMPDASKGCKGSLGWSGDTQLTGTCWQVSNGPALPRAYQVRWPHATARLTADSLMPRQPRGSLEEFWMNHPGPGCLGQVGGWGICHASSPALKSSQAMHASNNELGSQLSRPSAPVSAACRQGVSSDQLPAAGLSSGDHYVPAARTATLA